MMKQEDIYLKLTQPNLSVNVPIIIPLKGLIGTATTGSVVTYYYKGTSSKLAIVVQTGEEEALKETINRAIVAAIKGGEQQQYYPVEIYSRTTINGGWI